MVEHFRPKLGYNEVDWLNHKTSNWEQEAKQAAEEYRIKSRILVDQTVCETVKEVKVDKLTNDVCGWINLDDNNEDSIDKSYVVVGPFGFFIVKGKWAHLRVFLKIRVREKNINRQLGEEQTPTTSS